MLKLMAESLLVKRIFAESQTISPQISADYKGAKFLYMEKSGRHNPP